MSWLITLAVTLISTVVCSAGSLWLSLRIVTWRRVTSFEGASGYAAIGLTILGTLGAAVVSFIAARVGVGLGDAGFGGQLLWALGCSLGALGVVGVVARLLADVPPKIDGRELNLLVELRFPPETITRPADPDETARLELGAMERTRRRVRMRRRGDLHFDRARLEDERWILPGRVDVFTARGQRLLLVEIDGRTEGFMVPLPAHPKARDTQWSDWLPRVRPDAGAPVNRFSYRFRIQPEV